MHHFLLNFDQGSDRRLFEIIPSDLGRVIGKQHGKEFPVINSSQLAFVIISPIANTIF